MIKFIIFLFLISCFSQKKDVLIFKQWHLSPQQNTLDIEKSKTISQFTNQKDIYLSLKKHIEDKTIEVIFVEGCENDIEREFEKEFNGWSLSKLKKMTAHKSYQSIMAPIGMKLYAKYPDFPILCGDNNSLIKENLLALSQIRAFYGFYSRLKESGKRSSETFTVYHQKLEEIAGEKIPDPVLYSKKKALFYIDEFYRLVKERNKSFVKNIKTSKYNKAAVVIGGLHSSDLTEKLEGISVREITPKGYNVEDEKLVDAIKIILQAPSYLKFQMENIFLEKFPSHNSIKEVIVSEGEKNELHSLLNENNLPVKLIYSDYDQDGIRDFTFSTKNGTLVIAAEDDDWDNDGVGNLVDDSIGNIKILELKKFKVLNNFGSMEKPDLLINKFKKRGLHLVGDQELLVLDIFIKLVETLKLDITQIKYIKSSSSTTTNKGRNTFFSYVKQNKSLEYNFHALFEYSVKMYKKFPKGTDWNLFIQNIVGKIIIHSLAHEIFHSRDWNKRFEVVTRSNWKYEKESVNSTYLVTGRLKRKKLSYLTTNQTYKNKSYAQWISLYQKHRGKRPFIIKENLPSIYALSDLDEYLAEVYSLCIFKKVFPQISYEGSIEMAQVLGINPGYVDAKICQKLE